MKKLIWLISLILLSKLGFAQKGQHAIGLQLGVNMASEDIGRKFNEFGPAYSYFGGLYYDWNFSRQFGISFSPSQRVQKYNGYSSCFVCLESTEVTYAYYFLDLPVNVTLNLSNKETASWKTYLVAGYTFNRLLWATMREKDTGKVTPQELRWQLRNISLVNFGFEIRHNLNDNFTLAISPNARIQVSEEVGSPFVGLSFKFGHIL